MAPDNLETLSAKELKIIATDMKLEFAKNASAVEMRELIRSNQNTPIVTDAQKETIDKLPDETTEELEDETPIIDEIPRVSGEYIVKQNIKRSGRRYEKGETIELDGEEAKNLLSEGIIE